jgi:hypothetical protein
VTPRPAHRVALRAFVVALGAGLGSVAGQAFDWFAGPHFIVDVESLVFGAATLAAPWTLACVAEDLARRLRPGWRWAPIVCCAAFGLPALTVVEAQVGAVFLGKSPLETLDLAARSYASLGRAALLAAWAHQFVIPLAVATARLLGARGPRALMTAVGIGLAVWALMAITPSSRSTAGLMTALQLATATGAIIADGVVQEWEHGRALAESMRA